MKPSPLPTMGNSGRRTATTMACSRSDAPARRAFLNLAPWGRLGVRPPKVASLSRAMSETFGYEVAVSVDEAVAALARTPLQARPPRDETRVLPEPSELR